MGPSGDIIESDNDDYYFNNGSNESSYFDEWNSQSIPPLVEPIVHQPVIPSNTIIHTVNVKRKKRN